MRRNECIHHAAAAALTLVLFLLVGVGRADAQLQLPPVIIDPGQLVPIPPPPPTLDPYPPTTAPSANGPYLARPSWDQTLPPHVRFVILTNFESDAVLDRETGLVWARRAVEPRTVSGKPRLFEACDDLVIANRGGWRLPTGPEAMTLLDFSVPDSGLGPDTEPRLPPGHPFLLSPADLMSGGDRYRYWWYPTSDIRDLDSGAGPSRARSVIDFGRGRVLQLGTIDSSIVPYALCVRGPQ